MALFMAVSIELAEVACGKESHKISDIPSTLDPSLNVVVAVGIGCADSVSLLVSVWSLAGPADLFFLAGLGNLEDIDDFAFLKQEIIADSAKYAANCEIQHETVIREHFCI